MIIEYYKLEKRSDILASTLPQRNFAKSVRGKPVRFDVVKPEAIPTRSYSSEGVVYDDTYIAIPTVLGTINVHHSDKYGVSLGEDGFVYLGIKIED